MRENVNYAGYVNKGAAITLFIVRLALGGLMFEAGLSKLVSGFSAGGFLANVSGPFAGFYTAMAANQAALAAINVLVPWGEMLIGLTILFGAGIRFASFWGIIMMLLYYTASIPPEQGWISQHLIFAAVFLAFMFTGVGYFIGLDAFLATLEGKRHRLRFLLG